MENDASVCRQLYMNHRFNNSSPLIKTWICWDFLGGPVAKTPHSQCRGSGFDSWSGN